jgi:hypothetical protein
MLFRHMSANKLYLSLEYVIARPLKDYSVRWVLEIQVRCDACSPGSAAS